MPYDPMTGKHFGYNPQGYRAYNQQMQRNQQRYGGAMSIDRGDQLQAFQNRMDTMPGDMTARQQQRMDFLQNRRRDEMMQNRMGGSYGYQNPMRQGEVPLSQNIPNGVDLNNPLPENADAGYNTPPPTGGPLTYQQPRPPMPSPNQPTGMLSKPPMMPDRGNQIQKLQTRTMGQEGGMTDRQNQRMRFLQAQRKQGMTGGY